MNLIRKFLVKWPFILLLQINFVEGQVHSIICTIYLRGHSSVLAGLPSEELLRVKNKIQNIAARLVFQKSKKKRSRHSSLISTSLATRQIQSKTQARHSSFLSFQKLSSTILFISARIYQPSRSLMSSYEKLLTQRVSTKICGQRYLSIKHHLSGTPFQHTFAIQPLFLLSKLS